jgi:hypothetical protein
VRKLTLAGVLAMALAAFVASVGTASAASGGGCKLDGTATFDGAGLTATGTGPFTYGFSGPLSNCQSSTAGSPASGTVEAGVVWTDAATGEQFQEPRSTGKGGCSNSTTDGTGIIKWADGTITVIGYHTDGAAAAVKLQGSVLPSVTLPAINPAVGQPTEITITTTRYAGSSVLGALAFQANPTDCNAGVKSAGISGFTSLGSQS